MSLEEDLLADLDELDGNFDDDGHMDVVMHSTSEAHMGYSTALNFASTNTDIAALGEASNSGGIGEEHEALISRLASRSADIRSIAVVCHGDELCHLLSSIVNIQPAPDMNSQLMGRVEDSSDYRLVVQANEMSTRIAGETLVVHRFLLDHYKRRFPELETLVQNPTDYARAVKAIGGLADITKANLEGILPNATRMVVAVTGSTTTGRQLSEEELQRVNDACDCLLELVDAKAKIVGFIESRMPLIAPNLTAVVGSSTAAKLIVEAGSLSALSKIPSCNIQVLGKAQQTATGLSSLSTKKHVGVVYYSEVVGGVPDDFRLKMLRKVSAKCALAARVDAQNGAPDGAMGRQFRRELDAQVEKLLEAAPMNAVKPLPVPDEGPKRRRGGRKVRKAREPYMSTELQKQRDRLQFGKFQDEVVVMDEMQGLGMIGHSAGHVRATQQNNRAKAKVAKKYEKYMKAPTAPAISGIATIAFTPVQGFELISPQPNDAHRKKRAKLEQDRYFSSSTPFLGKKDAA
ncbi:U4/U6-U5 snRNP complex subunit prp31 [Coemansia thaxteri]|uniref:U4/U6-U5 snRNP complex subunit prp31 n=1 Tax=Coemansia thaxteri TaxID=2663907 RepID=A0A9W8EEE6_9FUNG|nr:U4/U6-U5 snRNP complex subunit prp31 [Coemansia thaxteri]KAJ2001636.1 U4/U6-U5 snRNP complex subunit prp31 [Coemansia thaxteri]KAJ2478219.1 U4/U6-U5 snRNP complex subunit prp31 [Coemansia sp. RSA 2320]